MNFDEKILSATLCRNCGMWEVLKIGTFIYRKNIELPPVTPPMPLEAL